MSLQARQAPKAPARSAAQAEGASGPPISGDPLSANRRAAPWRAAWRACGGAAPGMALRHPPRWNNEEERSAAPPLPCSGRGGGGRGGHHRACGSAAHSWSGCARRPWGGTALLPGSKIAGRGRPLTRSIKNEELVLQFRNILMGASTIGARAELSGTNPCGPHTSRMREAPGAGGGAEARRRGSLRSCCPYPVQASVLISAKAGK